MSRRGSGLAGKLLAIAERHRGEFITIADATRATSNGGGPLPYRRVYQAVYVLKAKGRLFGGRGGFMLPALVAPSKLTQYEQLAVVTPRPMSRAAVRHELNQLRLAKTAWDNFFDEKISEIHRANGSGDAIIDGAERPSFPMRCTRAGEIDD